MYDSPTAGIEGVLGGCNRVLRFSAHAPSDAEVVSRRLRAVIPERTG
jgi:hypothetical protein